MENFALFKVFPGMEEAQGIITILEENNIPFSLIDNAHDVDITFTGNLQSNLQLLLQPNDFGKVTELIEKAQDEAVNEADPSHYLFEFSTEELFDLIEKKDEWSAYDYALAKKILQDRGEDVSEIRLIHLEEKRKADLKEPENSPTVQIIVGYISAILGGIIGIMIGWYLWKSTKTLPDGQKIFVYNRGDRDHGMIIFCIGVLSITVTIFLSFFIA